MNKNQELEVGQWESITTNTIKTVKVSAIVIVAAFFGLGVYVAGNTDLRNQVIDHAQGQSVVADLN